MKGYKTLAHAERGYRKRVEGRACEDACRILRTPAGILMAVADGHGDARCLFAARGAELAVHAALDVLRSYLAAAPKSRVSDYYNGARKEIARRIHAAYARAVLTDYAARFPGRLVAGEEERLLSLFEREADAGAIDQAQLRDRYAEKKKNTARLCEILYFYGTTLRASLLTPRYLFSLSLGDGDSVAEIAGRVTWLLPQGEAYSCETASLCEDPDTVEENFLFSYLPLGRDRGGLSDPYERPAFLMLSTDGLRNSFPGEAHFCDCVARLFRTVRRGSEKNGKRAVARLFARLTRESIFQDDITVAMACLEEE